MDTFDRIEAGDAIKAGLAALALGAATAVAGATEHGPALLLRALVVVTILAILPATPSGLRRRHVVAPIVAVAVVIFGLALSPVPGFALQSVISVGLVCGLFGALVLAERSLWPWIAVVAGAVGCAHALWAVGQWLGTGDRGSGGFFSPNDLAAFIAPLAVLALAWGVTEPANSASPAQAAGWRRAGACAAAALLGAGLVATGSRSGLLAGLTGVGILVWTRLAGRRRWQAASIGGAAALVVLLTVLFWARWSGEEDPYAFARLQIWKRTAAVAVAHPLGVGLGFYREQMRSEGVALAGPVRYPKVARHAHSEPLHAWAELGWLGLLATLLPGGAVLLSLRRAPPPDGEPPGLGWALLATFAIPAAISGSLHVPPVAFLAAAWAAHVSKQDTAPGPQLAPPRRRLLAAAPLLLLLLLAVPGAISAHAAEAAAARRARGDLPGAQALAQLAASSAPWSLGAAMLVESLHYLRGKPPAEVSEALLEIAERFPYSPRPLDRAAWVLERAAAGEEGIRLWRAAAAIREQAVQRDPHNAEAWYRWAAAQQAAGDRAGAEATLTRLLAEEPLMARALVQLARHAHRRGDLARARELADRARAADRLVPTVEPGYPASLLRLGPRERLVLKELGLGES